MGANQQKEEKGFSSYLDLFKLEKNIEKLRSNPAVGFLFTYNIILYIDMYIIINVVSSAQNNFFGAIFLKSGFKLTLF